MPDLGLDSSAGLVELPYHAEVEQLGLEGLVVRAHAGHDAIVTPRSPDRERGRNVAIGNVELEDVEELQGWGVAVVGAVPGEGQVRAAAAPSPVEVTMLCA